jgi:hypothetical protein
LARFFREAAFSDNFGEDWNSYGLCDSRSGPGRSAPLTRLNTNGDTPSAVLEPLNARDGGRLFTMYGIVGMEIPGYRDIHTCEVMPKRGFKVEPGFREI